MSVALSLSQNASCLRHNLIPHRLILALDRHEEPGWPGREGLHGNSHGDQLVGSYAEGLLTLSRGSRHARARLPRTCCPEARHWEARDSKLPPSTCSKWLKGQASVPMSAGTHSDAQAPQLRRLLRAVPCSKASGTFHSLYKHVTCTPVCQGLCWLLGVAVTWTNWPHLGPWDSGAERLLRDTTPKPPGLAG